MSSIFLQLQSTARNTTIQPNDNLIFDQTLAVSDTVNITYDSNTGMFLFHTAGVYYISWSAAVSETPATVSTELALVTSNGDYYRANSSLLTDEVSGSAIVTIGLPDTSLYVRNLSSGNIQLSSVDIVANIVIHSIEASALGPGVIIAPPGSGSVINLGSGGIDITNPLTFPVLLEVLQISLVQNEIDDLTNVFSCEGLESLFGMPGGILGLVANGIMNVVLAPCRTILNALLGPLNDICGPTTNEGLISMDAYIGHANVGIVPALAGADIPILSLIAGPPYPQIIARDGYITSFAAKMDCLAALDVSVFNTIAGVFTTLFNLILELISAVASVIATLANIASDLLGLGALLPDDYADILNNKIFRLWRMTTPDSNHHVHAILWKGNTIGNNALGGDVVWEKVSDLDLGPIPWAELSLVDVFISSLGDILEAGGNLIETIITLLGTHGEENLSPTNLPFVDARISGLNYPISVGDYLMVQFTLIGTDNSTVLAGVLATELMASVTIACDSSIDSQQGQRELGGNV